MVSTWLIQCIAHVVICRINSYCPPRQYVSPHGALVHIAGMYHDTWTPSGYYRTIAQWYHNAMATHILTRTKKALMFEMPSDQTTMSSMGSMRLPFIWSEWISIYRPCGQAYHHALHWFMRSTWSHTRAYRISKCLFIRRHAWHIQVLVHSVSHASKCLTYPSACSFSVPHIRALIYSMSPPPIVSHIWVFIHLVSHALQVPHTFKRLT